METRVSKLLGTKYPVIQGGMAWVAEYHLAAAVSNAGGLGIIGAASAPPEVVREQIREAKKLTDKPFGYLLRGYQEQGGRRLRGGFQRCHQHRWCQAPCTCYGYLEQCQPQQCCQREKG